MHQVYPYFIKFHIIFSVLFLLTIVGITIHSITGWISGREYSNTENRFRRLYLILLYIDMILGVILYFFLQKPAEVMTTEEAMKFSTLRFWAIQHFSNIIFVVILCTIGNILIQKTGSSSKKFKYSVFYFGISTIIIIISVSFFALRK
jgi:hypothetical protein